jgi:two-component system response regulator HydG
MDTKILIVEDQFIEANNLRIILRKAGYAVCSLASSVDEALKIKKNEKPDLVLLDIRLQGKLTGIDLAKILREENMAFIFLSANSSKEILNAAKATRPYGFLVKPFREKDVLVSLDVALYLHQQNQKGIGADLSAVNKFSPDVFKEIIGNSPGMLAVLNNIKIVGNSEISVLILGESGTGKELVAQCIHRLSARASRPLIVVNCAALPANLIESELFGHEKGAFTGAVEKRIGKFEQGNEGTVFLDEIGELPMDLQVKLLRVLQEKEIEPIGGKKRKIDVRIIAATNRKLEDEVAAGRFRLDLYYRLNVFPISLPPLRERKEDLLLLANHFLQQFSTREKKPVTRLAEHVVAGLLNYSWPGNIRELENMMARGVLLATDGLISDLEFPYSTKNEISGVLPQNAIRTIDENERDYILSVLKKCQGKLHGFQGAAKMMDINVSTLRSRMKKLGIERGNYS